MKVFILFFILFISCAVKQKSQLSEMASPDSIYFVVLTIYKDSITNTNKIELISKTESNGKLKKQHVNSLHSPNYLTLYVYTNKKPVDSVNLEHPLYKHFEYPGDDKTFIVKDTVIAKAEFFFRIQKQGMAAKLNIFETIKDKPKKQLASIQL